MKNCHNLMKALFAIQKEFFIKESNSKDNKSLTLNSFFKLFLYLKTYYFTNDKKVKKYNDLVELEKEVVELFKYHISLKQIKADMLEIKKLYEEIIFNYGLKSDSNEIKKQVIVFKLILIYIRDLITKSTINLIDDNHIEQLNVLNIFIFPELYFNFKFEHKSKSSEEGVKDKFSTHNTNIKEDDKLAFYKEIISNNNIKAYFYRKNAIKDLNDFVILIKNLKNIYDCEISINNYDNNLINSDISNTNSNTNTKSRIKTKNDNNDKFYFYCFVYFFKRVLNMLFNKTLSIKIVKLNDFDLYKTPCLNILCLLYFDYFLLNLLFDFNDKNSSSQDKDNSNIDNYNNIAGFLRFQNNKKIDNDLFFKKLNLSVFNHDDNDKDNKSSIFRYLSFTVISKLTSLKEMFDIEKNFYSSKYYNQIKQNLAEIDNHNWNIDIYENTIALNQAYNNTLHCKNNIEKSKNKMNLEYFVSLQIHNLLCSTIILISNYSKTKYIDNNLDYIKSPFSFSFKFLLTIKKIIKTNNNSMSKYNNNNIKKDDSPTEETHLVELKFSNNIYISAYLYIYLSYLLNNLKGVISIISKELFLILSRHYLSSTDSTNINTSNYEIISIPIDYSYTNIQYFFKEDLKDFIFKAKIQLINQSNTCQVYLYPIIKANKANTELLNEDNSTLDNINNNFCAYIKVMNWKPSLKEGYNDDVEETYLDLWSDIITVLAVYENYYRIFLNKIDSDNNNNNFNNKAEETKEDNKDSLKNYLLLKFLDKTTLLINIKHSTIYISKTLDEINLFEKNKSKIKADEFSIFRLIYILLNKDKNTYYKNTKLPNSNSLIYIDNKESKLFDILGNINKFSFVFSFNLQSNSSPSFYTYYKFTIPALNSKSFKDKDSHSNKTKSLIESHLIDIISIFKLTKYNKNNSLILVHKNELFNLLLDNYIQLVNNEESVFDRKYLMSLLSAITSLTETYESKYSLDNLIILIKKYSIKLFNLIVVMSSNVGFKMREYFELSYNCYILNDLYLEGGIMHLLDYLELFNMRIKRNCINNSNIISNNETSIKTNDNAIFQCQYDIDDNESYDHNSHLTNIENSIIFKISNLETSLVLIEEKYNNTSSTTNTTFKHENFLRTREYLNKDCFLALVFSLKKNIYTKILYKKRYIFFYLRKYFIHKTKLVYIVINKDDRKLETNLTINNVSNNLINFTFEV